MATTRQQQQQEELMKPQNRHKHELIAYDVNAAACNNVVLETGQKRKNQN